MFPNFITEYTNKCVFLSTPYRGLMKYNSRLNGAGADRYAHKIARLFAVYTRIIFHEAVPLSPVLAFSKVYREDLNITVSAKNDPERRAAAKACKELLGLCDVFFCIENFLPYSEGMQSELEYAKINGLHIYRTDIQQINSLLEHTSELERI